MAEENQKDNETIPEPKPFPPELTESGEAESVGHMVREYIWGKGPVDHMSVSGNLNREWVSKFVEFELDGLPSRYYWRVRILADLYNLSEILPNLQMVLNRKEAEPDDLDRSLATSVMLEEIGDEANKERARSYFPYLVAHKMAEDKYPEMINCLAAFGNSVEMDPLKSRMEKDSAALIAKDDTDPDSGTKGRDIEDLVGNEFFFIEEANEARERIDGIKDPGARLTELINAYFELTDDGGAEYFSLWTQQQIRRAAEADGAETVISALRAALKQINKFKEADEEFCKIRCFNAIEYFNGKLGSEESVFMAKNGHKQKDPLRFIPLEFHFGEPDDEVEEDDELEDTESEEGGEKNEGEPT